MNGWFIAMIILYALSLGGEMSKHGQKREGTHNFYVTLVTCLVLVFIIYKAIQTGF